MKKEWHEICVATRNGEKVFERKDGTFEAWETIAKVKSIGLAYKVAKDLEEVYKKENYIIVVY